MTPPAPVLQLAEPEISRPGSAMAAESCKGPCRLTGLGLALAGCLICMPAAGWELDARLKWFGSLSALPENDVQRELNGTPDFSDNLDLRLLIREERGPLSILIDHSTTLLRADATALPGAPGLTLDQSADNDERRLMDLTWTLDEGSRHRLLHRFDRLAVRYNRSGWSLTMGRQAVSWGSGLVFQPLDLFNPFAPTTVDTDYKTGDDLVLLERLFDDGSDLQLLAVARRDRDGDFSGTVGSVAGKWHGFVGQGELELLAAKHYQDQVYGVTLRWPLGGAMLRSDLAATRLDSGAWKLSGILNADYSLVLGGHNLYVFGEYFHNGFGVSRLPPSLSGYPQPLLDRLERGELFNLMRDYLAAGVSIEWHPLWNHAVTVIGNLHDRSVLLQSQISYEPGDNQHVDLGLVHPLGGTGDEFGGVPVTRNSAGDLLTTGGGTRGYLRWAYYF